MHSVGPESTTANADTVEAGKRREAPPVQDLPQEDGHLNEAGENVNSNQTANTNVIPTSPQYGVAIIPVTTAIDVAAEAITVATDTLTETTAKSADFNHKDMHSTPSRNDRFKVVKIASLEPFRRGRWKCMDFVDQTPQTTTNNPSKSTQSQGSVQMTGTVYMQTQSLPQQQIQQMLMQGGYPNPTQYYQNMPNQVTPQTQYFYTSQNLQNVPLQSFPQQIGGIPQNNIQTQFVNTSQAFIPQNMIPSSTVITIPNFQGVHYVPANQGSAFVPTTQPVVPQLPPNFQQSQTYAGAPSVSQSNVVQPVVNGHAYPPNEPPQVQGSSLPTQAAKNILNSTAQPALSQSQINPTQTIAQTQIQTTLPVQNNHQSQPINLANIQNTQFTQLQAQTFPQQNVVVLGQIPINQPNHQTLNQIQHSLSHMQSAPSTMVSIPQSIAQNINNQIDPNQTTNVYTNPQFVASVNSVANNENETNNSESQAESGNADENTGDDNTKANPVVNAIDNKIEQAMDLVKSHLMYTVREEVEVLKEKIAELMERIQQLETENNYLRSQLPKPNQNSNNSSDGSQQQ